MEHIEYWLADDGKKFNRKEDCEKYEKLCKELNDIVGLNDGVIKEGLRNIHRYYGVVERN